MIVIGAGGHAKVIIEIMELLQEEVVVFDEKHDNTKVFDYDITHDFCFDENQIGVIAMGNNLIRKQISEKYKINFGNVIHPSSVLSKRVTIASGNVIMAGVIVNSSTRIGNHCIINTNSSIDHDCVIEDFVHISPNVTLCGNISVGEGTHIGAGATVIPNIKIGKWCTIGAGAVVTKHLPDNCTAVGIPAKPIKFHE